MTISAKLLVGLVLAGLVPVPVALEAAQTPEAAAQAIRVVGTIAAIDGKSLTIKPDAGATVIVIVSDTARVLRTEPGAKTLAGASPIQMTDLAVGDRVLLAVTPGAAGAPGTAMTVIAMKRSDIAQRQRAEQADWQRRGVGGLVKTVDPATGTVTITAGSQTLVIHTSSTTIFRRYDPESIKFSDAKPSSLDQIHPGDQLRARGDRSADGSEVTADELVFGSFRNIGGIVESVDVAANTVTVNDLETRKPIVIRVTADSQMHKLPEMMARALAARLKNPNGAGVGAAGASQAEEGASRQGAGTGASPGAQRGGDLSQMLQRTPAVQLGDLHKGDAVMIVATQGTPAAATAVTLLAGVEPLLTASPAASQSMFSASWSLGGGSAADAAGTP